MEKGRLSPIEGTTFEELDQQLVDYRRLARVRLYWIIGLSSVIVGLLAGIIYLEIARPVMEYHQRNP